MARESFEEDNQPILWILEDRIDIYRAVVLLLPMRPPTLSQPG